MGNWNRRWIPRKKYHQEAPASPPRPCRTELDPPGVWQSSVPSWEKKFCTLVGSIPWQKVVVAKKYMNCHDNVVNWNDSAGEEAFHNAKKRFWAEINGLPCDIPLSDPDMYIDEINWNPDIDPELMLDLDREYFNPDEREKDDKVEISDLKAHNSVSGRALGWDDKNPGNGDNPWECSYVQGTGALKDVSQGWNQWDNSRKLDKVDNPWEYSYAQGARALKDNAWGGCGDISWGWNQGLNCISQSKNLDNNCDNPWEQGSQSVGSVKEKGRGVVGNDSWGNHWEINVHGSRNMDKRNNHWEKNFIQGSGALKDRGWRDCGDNSWGWKQWENQINEPKHLDSRKTSGGWGTLNGGCRKREGSYQHSLRYKSSRFQGDDCGTGHHWSRGRIQKRNTFVFE